MRCSCDIIEFYTLGVSDTFVGKINGTEADLKYPPPVPCTVQLKA